MDCAEEIAILRREIGPVAGGEDRLSFDLLKGIVIVEDTSASPDAIVAAVARTGMRAEPWRGEPDVARRSFWEIRGRTALTAASGLAVSAGFAVHAWLAGGILEILRPEGTAAGGAPPLAARTLYTIAIVAGGWYVFPKAWAALRRFRPDMNLLMTIAVFGAVAIGEWFEAATVSFLFGLSLALESWSVARARRAVEALLDLAPALVRIQIPGGGERQVRAEDVPVGALFLVNPGDRIPLDGQVAGGTSEVNQASITGESVPVAKEPGADVFAGTVNGNGALEVRSTKPASDTVLAHIIRLIEQAQHRRAASEQWVNRFAQYYTPAVMALAAGVLVIPPILLNAPWHEWIYRSLVLLVIACPCALVISTPVSIVAALAAAARSGVLIKGGIFVEAPAHLQAVAIDKTGTLTKGRPVVVEVVALNGYNEGRLLQIATGIESRTDHPLAQALVSHAKSRGIAPAEATNVQVLPGKGITAQIGGRPFWLGSHRHARERGQETAEIREHAERLSGLGRTIVFAGDDARVIGLIAFADEIRPGIRDVVHRLYKAGIRHVVMLTGDNERTAAAVAADVGITEFRAELLPEDKVAAVEELVVRYGPTAMVGDGINDAPAMARSSLGIAMGAAGNDAAIEAADVALMSDDLSKVPWLLAHSRRTLAIIRQNVVASLFVKVVFVMLTFAGYASLWAAITADMGVSLLVIFNALRLLRADTRE
jgi:Zn2+/Cd2+-exporting ATPase